jgi:hypothetical protein
MSSTSASTEPPSTANTIYCDGTLPPQTSNIARLFTQTNEEQLTLANTMAKFIVDKTDTSTLNHDSNATTFLISLPKMRKVRVLYGIGTGLGINGILPNPIESNILALYGDVEKGVSLPKTLILPPNALELKEIKTPDTTTFQLNARSETNKRKDKWYKAEDITTSSFVPAVVPIPAFFVYDGLDTDLDAMVIYERLQPYKNNDNMLNSFTLLMDFIKSTTVSTKVSEPAIRINTDLFLQHDSNETVKWRKTRVQTIFPTLLPSTPPTTPTATPTALTAEAIAAIIAATTQASATANGTAPTADTAQPDTTLGLSESVYKKILTMCGIAAGQEDETPELWKQLSEKNLNKNDKASLIQQTLNREIKWNDSKVKPLTYLISMVIQRNFEGETSMSSLLSAAKGLTPFAFPCLSEAQVDDFNELTQAITDATTTTISDVRATKFKATSPGTFEGLLKRLKRLGNFLFAIFGEGCPLLENLEACIIDLDDYNETARTNMTRRSIASILWIVHLQARHFSAGLMAGTNALKAEFSHMCNCIKMKLPVEHGEVPTELYIQKVPDLPNPAAKPNHDQQKRQKLSHDTPRDTPPVKRDCYHPKLQAAMKPFVEAEKPISLFKLTKAAGTRSFDLFPFNDKLCIKAQIWGQCPKDCKHQHTKISNEQAESVLKKLDKVIQNPNLVTKVN